MVNLSLEFREKCFPRLHYNLIIYSQTIITKIKYYYLFQTADIIQYNIIIKNNLVITFITFTHYNIKFDVED